MKKDKTRRRAQVRFRQVVGLMLLALPVLFWATVFATLSGVRLPATLADTLSDVAQSLIALACLLLLVLRHSDSAFFEMQESVGILFSEGGNLT